MVAFANQNGTFRAFNRPVVCNRPVAERMRSMENLTVVLFKWAAARIWHVSYLRK